MRDESWYDTAQVCQNGHIINETAQSRPESNETFCQICGAATTMKCDACGATIRGYHHVPGVLTVSTMPLPAYCYTCGAPYPWTSTALDAARELADELDYLTPSEREQLKATLDDLVRDTPRTQVASYRFERLAAKAGSGAADMFKEILVSVASETARKLLWGM